MKHFNKHYFSQLRVSLFTAALFFALALNVAMSQPALAQTTITVNTTADVAANDGTCSLREAITAANTDTASGAAGGECLAGSGADVIAFAIGTGAQTITLGSELPNITQAVMIDGSTQPDFTSTPLITLDGNGAGSYPLQLSASNSTLKDLAVRADTGTGLMLSSVVTVTLENLDLSTPGACTFGDSGIGLYVTNSSHLLVDNVSVANRGSGMIFQTGSDVELTDNDLSGSGCANVAYALHVDTITVDGNNGRGLLASGNTFTNAHRGILLANMQDLVIDNVTSPASSHYLVLEDGSGMGTLSGVSLDLNTVLTTTIQNVDLASPTTCDFNNSGIGLYATNSSHLLVDNVSVANRGSGMIFQTGSDVELTDNDLSGSGCANVAYALHMGTITVDEDNGRGVIAARNTFTNAHRGILLANMQDLVIDNVTPPSSSHYLVLEDSSGMGTLSGVSLDLNTVLTTTIQNVDLASPTTCDFNNSGIGIYATNSSHLLVDNVSVANRGSGMIFQTGSDVELTDNDLSGSGCANVAYALHVDTITVDEDNGRGVIAARNTFTNAHRGILLANMQDLVIDNVTSPASSHYLVLEDSSGMGTLSGVSLDLNTVLTTTIQNVDLASPTTCDFNNSGIGLYATNSSHLLVDNVSVANRGSGMIFQTGSDVELTDNDLSGSGCANTAFGLQVNTITVDASNGRGLLASGNTFTNTNQGILLENLTGLAINNVTPLTSTHYLVLEDGSGIGAVANTSLWLSNVATTTVQNINLASGGAGRTGNGLYIVGGANLSIQAVRAKNRNTGISVLNTTGAVVSCNTLINNATGLNINQAATILNNHFQDNTTGIAMGGSSTLNAENNFWGAANGPKTLGGSGDAYSGNVDAQPFLTSVPPCAPQFIYTVSIATSGTGTGSISLNPPGGSYSYGTVVTATASAGITSTFAGWSGACTGTGACVIAVKANKAVSAAFNFASTPTTPTPTTPSTPTPTTPTPTTPTPTATPSTPTSTPTSNCPLVVTNVNDSGAGSLRQAIADAGPACSQVVFGAGLTGQTIRLASQLVIEKNVTINGSGRKITVSGDTDNNGSGDVAVFTINSGTVTLRQLTITKGLGTDGLGGGVSISIGARVHILQSTIRDSISDNGSAFSAGGGIYNTGVLTLTNSTVSGNQAANFAGLGGGIHSSFGSVAIIRYSTITGNSAPSDGVGGGINVEGGNVTLIGSIVSGNGAATGAEIAFNNGGILVVNGHNVIGSNGNAGMMGATPGATDRIPAGAVSTLINTTLADNGGDSATHALVVGGPAHDVIPANTQGCGTIITVDQRGEIRPAGAGCDVGAVEFSTAPTPTPTAPPGTPTATGTPTPTPTATPGTPTPPLPTSDATTIAQPGATATLTYSDPAGGGIAIQIPAGAVDQATTFLYDDQEAPSHAGAFQFAGRTFTLTAYQNNSAVSDFTFQQPITLVIDYTDSDVAGLDENKLTLFFYDVTRGSWSEQGIRVVARDPANNRITLQINHLTEFAMGTTNRLYLPTIRR